MAKVKKRYEGINDRDFYKFVALSVGTLIAVVYAVNSFNFQKVPKASSVPKQEMRLEKMVDIDAYETIEPVYDAKNSKVYFNVEDRRNHVDYGKLTGGSLKLYDLDNNLVFDKNFEQNEVVEVKSDYLIRDEYKVRYLSADNKYTITFKKKFNSK